MKKIGLFIILVIIASNFIPTMSIEVFHYQTKNNEFQDAVVPSKGRSYEGIITRFDVFKEDNPQHKDLVLYRTFERPLWKFWKWKEYLLNPIWKHPFYLKSE